MSKTYHRPRGKGKTRPEDKYEHNSRRRRHDKSEASRLAGLRALQTTTTEGQARQIAEAFDDGE